MSIVFIVSVRVLSIVCVPFLGSVVPHPMFSYTTAYYLNAVNETKKPKMLVFRFNIIESHGCRTLVHNDSFLVCFPRRYSAYSLAWLY